MEKLLALVLFVLPFLIAIAVIVAVPIAIVWSVWMLWCWILPQAWAGGPETFINPSFWVFLGMWVLVRIGVFLTK